jgi:hypothetical protein
LERGGEGTLSAVKRNQNIDNKGGKKINKVGGSSWRKEKSSYFLRKTQPTRGERPRKANEDNRHFKGE